MSDGFSMDREWMRGVRFYETPSELRESGPSVPRDDDRQDEAIADAMEAATFLKQHRARHFKELTDEGWHWLFWAEAQLRWWVEDNLTPAADLRRI